jgi:hypothetical protein
MRQLLFIFVFLFITGSHAQFPLPSSSQIFPDTTRDSLPQSMVEPSDTTEEYDSVGVTVIQPPSEAGKGKKIQLVKRKFNYREQIGMAIAMMAFMTLIITTTDTWNPR